jgi:nuclear GTP-binding protein
MNLLEVESFEDTFGSRRKRKKPKLGEAAASLEAMVEAAQSKSEKYTPESDPNIDVSLDYKHALNEQHLFDKGQSKRIWAELYKVVDCSDIVVQVLDARDPIGTRSRHIEKHLKKNASHKHLVLILNKCDLVPTWATARWVKILGKEYPTLAFHASLTNSFGKGALINLLRQFSQLHKDKKSVSVGFIGYPNVGKSSIINTLKGQKSCNVAPIPGETKIWQYVTLMRRVFMIDCPGVVYHMTADDDGDSVLKGVVRVENLTYAEQYAELVVKRVKKEYLVKTYKIEGWTTDKPIDFLECMARRYGKLMKGGEPDTQTVAKMLLNDWQRGKIPWFQAPPFDDEGKDGKPEKDAKDAKADAVAGEAPAGDAVPVPVPKQSFQKMGQIHEYDEADSVAPAGQEVEGDEEGEDDDDIVNWDDVYENEDDEAEPIQPDTAALDETSRDAEIQRKKAAQLPEEPAAFTGAFVECKKFAGARAGYVFKNDAEGVGYYKDQYEKPKLAWVNTQFQKRGGKANKKPGGKNSKSGRRR